MTTTNASPEDGITQTLGRMSLGHVGDLEVVMAGIEKVLLDVDPGPWMTREGILRRLLPQLSRGGIDHFYDFALMRSVYVERVVICNNRYALRERADGARWR